MNIGQQFGGNGQITTSLRTGGGSSSGGGGLGTLGTIAGIASTALPLLNKLGIFGEGGISGALGSLFGGNAASELAIQPTSVASLGESILPSSIASLGESIPSLGITGEAVPWSVGQGLKDFIGSSAFSLAPSAGISNLGGLIGANTGTGLLGALGPITAGLSAANFFGNLGQKGVRSEFLGPFGFSTAGQTISDYKAEIAGGNKITNQVFQQLQSGSPIDPGDTKRGWFSPVFGPSSRGFNKQPLTPQMIAVDPSLWRGADREDIPSPGFVADSPAIGLRIAQEILTGQRHRGEGVQNGKYITQNIGPYAPSGQFELVNPPKPNGDPSGTGRFVTVPTFAVSPDDVEIWLKDRTTPYTQAELQAQADKAGEADRRRELRDIRRGGSSPRD